MAESPELIKQLNELATLFGLVELIKYIYYLLNMGHIDQLTSQAYKKKTTLFKKHIFV